MSDCPSFSEFYRAVHQRDPLPWQRRLAEEVDDQGWGRPIGVPTGLGKTAAIDIAVWALARQAGRPPRERTAPTRVWYVVNRRLLVDAALDHTQWLAELLWRPDAVDDPSARAVLKAVSDRLHSLSPTTPSSGPLVVSRLRGGAESGRRPPHPAQPAVICSTVPMFASRVLFCGYGSSRSMRPVDAALAGTDCVVLLDEAHLAQPLQRLVSAIPLCDANRVGALRPPGVNVRAEPATALLPGSRERPILVSLTATGTAGDRFDLSDDDFANPIVQTRLSAHKPTRLVATPVAQLPHCLAAAAREVSDAVGSNGGILVFVNRPSTARAVASHLRDLDADVLVLTGQMREPDAVEVRRRLLDPTTGFPSGARPARQRPLMVIATQTLEVGADLDADALVTQSAGVRALTQRFGRLNRLGIKTSAPARLVHCTDQGDDWLYGSEPNILFDRLGGDGAEVDLAPGQIAHLLGSPMDFVPELPELLPFHLWEWAKTSSAIDAAPPELFFDGFDDAASAVSIAWRAYALSGEPLVPAAHADEFIEVPIGDARAFVRRCGSVNRLDSDGIGLSAVDADVLRPGDRLIARVDAGGYGVSGWDPDVTDQVRDISPLVRNAIWLVPEAVENLLARPLDERTRGLIEALQVSDDDPADADADRVAAEDLLAYLKSSVPELGPATRPRVSRHGERQIPLLEWDRPAIVAAQQDALDELSIAPSVQLDVHLAAVGELAAAIAARIGLAPVTVHSIREAGRLHDLGKADPRFQRWLDAPAGELRAKSDIDPRRWGAARVKAGWPSGGRHELLSVQMLDAFLGCGDQIDSPELVRHLIISHHGQGRPRCSISVDGGPLDAPQLVGGTGICHLDPTVEDWEQPRRFRDLCEEYGYWGLALLESCVRQADHVISAATEVL